MKGFLSYFAGRYIAGDERGEAIEVARELNTHSIVATIDNLGENVKDEKEAEESVVEYLALINDIKETGVQSTISLKLTHMGLDISEELAEKNTETIIKEAGKLKKFARVDMEGSRYTQRTVDTVVRLHEKHENVGVAIQTCLRRSRADVKLLIEKGISVRLVKGAYKEPPDIAYPDKKDVDESYSTLMKELLLKGNRPAIATHDERLIEEARRFVEENGISRSGFEFQMLLGIRRTLQKELARDGYIVRVYVPYGPNWMAYIMRRLKERKENVYFVMRHVFD
ncbi:MAG: proline dehydrogenase family protein [Thermodesulfobacteriota bacterium]